uniref:Uncharacterized protein n=1 Tax=Oryza glumipatula TaxID=40148 RepID=A0A0E0BUY0_9ORYZ
MTVRCNGCLAPPLLLIELRLEVTVDVDGNGGEVQGFGWEQLRMELGDRQHVVVTQEQFHTHHGYDHFQAFSCCYKSP